MNKKQLIIAVSCSAFFISACGKNGSDTVIARVGKVKITEADFAKELGQSPPSYRNYLSTSEGKKQFLDILLKEKILLNAAEKSGVMKKADVQKSLKDFEERIKQQQEEFKKGLVLREYLRELQDTELKIQEDDLKKYYEQNKNEYQNPVRVAASHILTPNESDAKVALDRVQKGENFAKVARELSKDPSAERGGMIGEVMPGDLSELPEFEAELFKLKPGQNSGIVKTKIGYHVIRKEKETHLPGLSFAEAGPQIRRILEKRKFDEWIEKSKTQQKLWVDDKALAAVKIPLAEKTQGLPQQIQPTTN